MKKNKSQIEIIKKKLENDGAVTRNWALSRYISRLGALIQFLKNDGWQCKTERIKNRYKKINTYGDYIYILVKKGS